MGMIADGVANKLPYVDQCGLWGSVMCETIFKDIWLSQVGQGHAFAEITGLCSASRRCQRQPTGRAIGRTLDDAIYSQK